MKGITYEQFVVAWQEAACIDDVCSKLGIAKGTAYVRANHLRVKGVNLKHFQKNTLNVERLNELVRQSSVGEIIQQK